VGGREERKSESKRNIPDYTLKGRKRGEKEKEGIHATPLRKGEKGGEEGKGRKPLPHGSDRMEKKKNLDVSIHSRKKKRGKERKTPRTNIFSRRGRGEKGGKEDQYLRLERKEQDF